MSLPTTSKPACPSAGTILPLPHAGSQTLPVKAERDRPAHCFRKRLRLAAVSPLGISSLVCLALFELSIAFRRNTADGMTANTVLLYGEGTSSVQSGRVVGLDCNSGMLGVARSVAGAGVTIEWCEGSALDLPFESASFDLVLCQLGLQFSLDRPRACRNEACAIASGPRCT